VTAGTCLIDLDDIASQSSMGLLGSCVARDMRSALFPYLARSQFFWRIGTISLMSTAGTPIDFQGRIAAADQLKTADRDINKTFDLQSLLQEKYILLDFYRDMYGIVRLADGRHITDGQEFRQYRLHELMTVEEKIPALDAQYPDLWLPSFLSFASQANASQARFLIQPVFQMVTAHRGNTLVVNPDWDYGKISRENRILGHMQRIALAALHRAWLLPAALEHIALDETHEYGPGPFHYKRSYFEETRELVRRCPTLAASLPAEDTCRGDMIRMEMAAWRTLVSGT
jgi:hypothetical protein